MDLSGANLDRARFEDVNFTNAKLEGDITFEGASFVDSHWWDAGAISKPLLEKLITEFYPYFDPENVTYLTPPPEKSKYIKLVL